MGAKRTVSSLNFAAEETTAQQSAALGKPIKPQIIAPNIAYAHTVSAGPSGRKFKIIITSIVLSLAIYGLLYPKQALMAALFTFTALIFVQAILRLAAIALPKSKFEITPHLKSSESLKPLETAAAEDWPDHENWPNYTVLIPLKDEAHMVTGLVQTLSSLEYPKDRLQIIFITEEDDLLTCRAVAAALQPPFEQVIVPRYGMSTPRTKPNALNAAMKMARGQFVTIYDAEDAPHPQQLKTAVAAFEKNPHWGALQAPLDYFNTRDSGLAAQFGLEHAAQFHVWIPLMVRLGLPFPLGGTSNHIRRGALESVRRGELYWDSYNVTEDADLSFRLAAHEWDIGYITPPTQEEAVSSFKPWSKQRTRWMKGFMQSWRVHMDSPLTPGGWRGLKRQITLQLTLGSVLLAGFFHAPICLTLLVWMAYSWLAAGEVLLAPLVWTSLCLGYGTGFIMGAIGAVRAKKAHLLWSVPLMPIYWICLCLPTYLAAYEYVRRPYYWAKTAHGKTANGKSQQAHPREPSQAQAVQSSPAAPAIRNTNIAVMAAE